MEVMIYLVLPCVGSIFLMGAMFYGAYRIAGRPAAGNPGGIRWAAAFAYIIGSVLLSLLGNTWVNLSSMLLFPFTAVWVFKMSRTYLAPYFILAAAVFLTDAAAGIGYQYLWMRGILYLNSQMLSYSLLVAASRMLEFMVILLIAMAAGKRAGREITARQIILSVFLPLFSIFNMYTNVYMMQIYLVDETVMLFVVNLILLIGLNIYFCVLIDIMGENRRLENERNLFRRQALMQYQYYEREEEKYEESRKLIHDIRNHIQVMEELYSREGAEDAARYAGDLHRMLDCFRQRYYTSDKLLNIILNDKAQYMRKAGIREDIKVGELSLDFMRDADVTALFANLLDNAIAAAAGCRGGYVRLRVNMVRQFLSVVMENSCDKEPVREGDGFRSRKPGHRGMGIGNIRQTVEQYGGDVQFVWKDGVFITKAVLVCDNAASAES